MVEDSAAIISSAVIEAAGDSSSSASSEFRVGDDSSSSINFGVLRVEGVSSALHPCLWNRLTRQCQCEEDSDLVASTS